MTDAPDTPDLNDVMVPTEDVHPDHREHAKTSRPLDEEELRRRAEHEQEEVRRQR